jgi:multiple sugar transport system permease protein
LRKYRTNTPALVVAAFLLPSLLGFVVFLLIPMIATLGLSFTNYSGGRRLNWLGFTNYLAAFASPGFLQSLWVTGKFVVMAVIAQLVLGFVFALLLNRRLAGRTMFRSLFFLPCILSSIAISLSFMIIFNPTVGPLNELLHSLGLPAVPWLTSPKTALLSIVIVTVWQSLGYYMVLFIAGLQTINPALYESADMDGATPMQRLVAITLPMISPTTFFCVTTAIIRGFQVFDQVYMMTGGRFGGGPAGATSVLVFDIYANAFQVLRMGYASAEATILLLFLFVITFIQYRAQRGWVTYDSA